MTHINNQSQVWSTVPMGIYSHRDQRIIRFNYGMRNDPITHSRCVHSTRNARLYIISNSPHEIFYSQRVYSMRKHMVILIHTFLTSLPSIPLFENNVIDSHQHTRSRIIWNVSTFMIHSLDTLSSSMSLTIKCELRSS